MRGSALLFTHRPKSTTSTAVKLPAKPRSASPHRRILRPLGVLLLTAVSVGVACDSPGSNSHPHSFNANLVAGHHDEMTRDELRQARTLFLSRSADRQMLDTQRETERKEQLAKERRLQRAQQARREAARKHRLAVERARAAWRAPLAEYDITARFGQSSDLWSTAHTGVDLAAGTGSPISALARGTVTFAAYDGMYGYKVVVRHDDGSETWYAHMATISVAVGQRVANTTVLGSVGSTGNVTGPHLHLELRPGGQGPVDPLEALARRGVHL